MPETGKVHWTMEGNGGFVDTEGSALPEWIGTFLRDPEREDVLSKLRRTDAQERWVFVPSVKRDRGAGTVWHRRGDTASMI